MTERDDFDPGPLRQTEEHPAVIDELHRITEECLQDPDSIASKRLLGQIYERELDELHTPDGSSYWSERRVSKSDEEKKQREERLMMGAVGGVVARGLKSHGIRLASIDLDETPIHGGYVAKCVDGAGREYTATFGLDLAERLASSGGASNLVERMGHAVVREILSERARYFRRMQPATVANQEESHG